MEPIICLDCGNTELGAIYEAFMLMKQYYLSDLFANNKHTVHIDNIMLDHHKDQTLEPVFKAFNIKKYCCRTQLITCRNMHDMDL